MQQAIEIVKSQVEEYKGASNYWMHLSFTASTRKERKHADEAWHAYTTRLVALESVLEKLQAAL